MSLPKETKGSGVNETQRLANYRELSLEGFRTITVLHLVSATPAMINDMSHFSVSLQSCMKLGHSVKCEERRKLETRNFHYLLVVVLFFWLCSCFCSVLCLGVFYSTLEYILESL